jgi:hypothetical protein
LRQFARHACRIETQIGNGEDSAGVAGNLTDISLGGCYVEMLSPLPVDSAVDLSFQVGETLLGVSGRVRSSHMALGMGIAFTGMTPGNFEALRRFAPPVTLPDQPVYMQPAHSYAQAGSDRAGLPASPEVLESLVRLLLRKGLLSQSDLAEDILKHKAVRN